MVHTGETFCFCINMFIEFVSWAHQTEAIDSSLIRLTQANKLTLFAELAFILHLEPTTAWK